MSAERGSLDIGVVGLGVMGGNLARNLADKGFRVGGQNLDHAVAERLAAEHPEAGLTIVKDLVELLPLLKRPRRLLLLVPSGGPVDAVIEALDPHLEDGDTVVDGGNSHYAATDARLKRAEGRPWEFVGMGVSGGAEGALKGPSLMPGGAERAYDNLAPLLTKIAAQGPYGPCVAHCGEGSAGHFVKMVHNGIEYGDMQLIAEVATLLREGLGQLGERRRRHLRRRGTRGSSRASSSRSPATSSAPPIRRAPRAPSSSTPSSIAPARRGPAAGPSSPPSSSAWPSRPSPPPSTRGCSARARRRASKRSGSSACRAPRPSKG
jgi:6-phosphogluconate dehydrogenase (decarboxylating)